jgi:hypothetical protein
VNSEKRKTKNGVLKRNLISKENMTEEEAGFYRGVAFAMVYLIDDRDEPTFAFELARLACLNFERLKLAKVGSYDKKIIMDAWRREQK